MLFAFSWGFGGFPFGKLYQKENRKQLMTKMAQKNFHYFQYFILCRGKNL